jgi:hypothetical protein
MDVSAATGWWVAAGIAIAAELGTGTFYLLMIAVGLAAGALAALVAWIGALLNTAQLADKTWFVVLLVLGLVSFGFIAMIAYVLAGPDGSTQLRSTRQGTGQADVVTAARG